MDCSLPDSFCPWGFPGKNTGVDCHFLLQEIFLTQGLNPSLLHFLHWHADSFTNVPPLASVLYLQPDSNCFTLEFILCSFLFDHFQFASIHGPNIPGSCAILLFTASDLASITSHPQLDVVFALAPSLHSFWSYFSTDLQ